MYLVSHFARKEIYLLSAILPSYWILKMSLNPQIISRAVFHTDVCYLRFTDIPSQYDRSITWHGGSLLTWFSEQPIPRASTCCRARDLGWRGGHVCMGHYKLSQWLLLVKQVQCTLCLRKIYFSYPEFSTTVRFVRYDVGWHVILSVKISTMSCVITITLVFL